MVEAMIVSATSTTNQVITEDHLIGKAGAGEAAARRWINRLVRDSQVAARGDDDAVILTPTAISKLLNFLDAAKARASDDGRTTYV